MPDTQFKSLFNKSASLALKVANFTDTKVDLITWENYVKYFESNFNLEVKIDEDYFPYEIKDFLSGKTVYKNGQTRIGINPYIPITRQHFTLSHELSHYILHINNNLYRSQNFNSLIDDEFNGRNLEEQEADTLASYIMVNPYAFMRAFALKNSWVDITEYFEMSSTALYHRVMYYLVSQKEYDFYESQRIIDNYENGNYDELSSMLYMDINNLIDYAGSAEFDLISESTFEIVN